MGQRIELHIFHRNRLFRDCLASVLSGVNYFHVTPHDHTQLENWDNLDASGTHVGLIDMQLPDGLAADLIRRLTQTMAAKAVVLVASDDPDAIIRCVGAGASGCVLEEASLEELHVAIDRIVAGETFCSPQLVSSMFQQLAELSRDSVTNQRSGEVNLTPREKQILGLMSNRLTNQEIANELSLSLYTVKNHVHNILEKMQVDDRFDAIEHARSRRLLPRERMTSVVGPRR